MYLAVVIDLFAIKPIGWAMSVSPDSKLTGKALSMAFESRDKPKGRDVPLRPRKSLHQPFLSSTVVALSNQAKLI
ncbi:hypothetical protein HN008_20240 [Vibrio parahaemolyticus]|nr:integrase core domain protein [Vibrio parahaemolyticus]MBE4097326.1 hypothetical protein [Vibrio parahaemolyticus]MBE4132704.1 hypothetical protein [Vibrio parahaemolyticus]MBX5339084.1 hypothetical protein [Vibrio parahaemolyticus]